VLEIVSVAFIDILPHLLRQFVPETSSLQLNCCLQLAAHKSKIVIRRSPVRFGQKLRTQNSYGFEITESQASCSKVLFQVIKANNVAFCPRNKHV